MKNAPLSLPEILKYMSCDERIFHSIEVFKSISSTNDWVLQQITNNRSLPVLCLAEAQTNGRGRRGRQWISPEASNIYMSLGWGFPLPTQHLGHLSLVIGIAIARVLKQHGINAGLKWPNDVLVNRRKIAGVLIETQIKHGQLTNAVIGIGLNVDMPRSDTALIDQPWTDVKSEYQAAYTINRSQLAGELIDSLVEVIRVFELKGFDDFRDEWRDCDVCMGEIVKINVHGQVIQGEIIGLDQHGGIILRTDNGDEQSYYAADISLQVT